MTEPPLPPPPPGADPPPRPPTSPPPPRAEPPPPPPGGYHAPPPPSAPPSSGRPSYGAPPEPPGGFGPPAGYGPPPSYGPPAGYGPPPGQPGEFSGPASQLSPQDDRTWGMLAHLGAILAAIVGLSFLGPLVVLLVQGPKSPFVRRHAVESLNFQITTYIAGFVSFLLIFVLIGLVMLPLVLLAWLIFSILAGIAANRGEDYRYPVNIRLIK